MAKFTVNDTTWTAVTKGGSALIDCINGEVLVTFELVQARDDAHILKDGGCALPYSGTNVGYAMARKGTAHLVVTDM